MTQPPSGPDANIGNIRVGNGRCDRCLSFHPRSYDCSPEPLSVQPEPAPEVGGVRGALLDAVISLEELAAAWPQDSLPAKQVCVRMANAINNGNAMLAASPPVAVGWQTMETAPRGAAVLVRDSYGDTSVALLDSDGWTAMADGKFMPDTVPNTGSDWLMLYPTHWQPLPAPPSADTLAGGEG